MTTTQEKLDGLKDQFLVGTRPAILQAQSTVDATALRPDALVVPASWCPDPKDATYDDLRFFGMRVMWDPEERLGLFYEVKPL